MLNSPFIASKYAIYIKFVTKNEKLIVMCKIKFNFAYKQLFLCVFRFYFSPTSNINIITMYRFISLIFLILFCFASENAAAQGVVLNNFSVNSVASDVKIAWNIQSETGVSEFRLYRKMSTETDYKYVGTIPANGSLSYTYTDDNVFKTEATTITYELRVIKNGTMYNFYSTFTHQTSSVQRTWGSIKSMFR